MGYSGQKVSIPLGQGGLLTDEAQGRIPPGKLISALNINLQNGIIEKEFGSTRLNSMPLPAGILGVYDFWPNDWTQRLIAVAKDGRVYDLSTESIYTPVGTVSIVSGASSGTFSTSQGLSLAGYFIQFQGSSTVYKIATHVYTDTAFTLSSAYTGTTLSGATYTASKYTEIVASGSAPTTLTVGLQVQMVTGGNETVNANRKLFILSGNDPVQVISGMGTVRTNISSPAADWTTGSYPLSAVVHRGRLFAFGNKNSPHRMYSSSATNHEDFSTVTNFQFDIWPGTGEKLICAWVYKSRQFVAKFPVGIYYLFDEDPSSSNWYYVKLTDAFGACSPNAYAPALDDGLLATSTGMIASLKGSFQLGDVETDNILSDLKIERFIRQNCSQESSFDRFAIYYEDKKQVYFSYRSPTGSKPDRMLLLDLSRKLPEPIFIDKDQPNCLALRKDERGVQRPIYGAEDGFIYRMDRQNRSVQSVGYRGEFQIPYTDLGTTNNKLFDFIEVTYEPCGKWNLSCEVLVDGRVIETLQFPMFYDRVLAASSVPQTYNFTLDATVHDSTAARLSGPIPRSIRKPCHVMGRSISLKFYNSGADQNFKVSTVTLYFRPVDENQKGNN